MRIQEHTPLAPLTTLGIGGPARWFVRAESEPEVWEADRTAKAELGDCRFFVLGGGSNLLVDDAGFPGLVLQVALEGIARRDTGNEAILSVGAGESWDGLVQYAVDRGLAGIECLAGIPGTVGGTPVQNVGAYGQEVAETIRSVRALDRTTGSFTELQAASCGFAYRTSVFNTTERGRYVITSVDFALQPGGAPSITYADLRKTFGSDQRPTLRATADAVRAIRRTKSMVIEASDPNSRSAGSFFQNPVVSEAELTGVARAAGTEVACVPHWAAGEGRIKLPAAWLLERAGFVRGYVMGRAGISTNHTLALVNRGDCTSAEIESLRNRIIDTVRRRFGITLQQEPISVR